MSLAEVLRDAENGRHHACAGCPCSPRREAEAVFGSSCEEHGVRWSDGSRAVSMTVLRDPATSTPSKTGQLCLVHNRRDKTNLTAQHAYDLWWAAVSLAAVGPAAHKFLREHYWTNAAVHGVRDMEPSRQEKVRQCCAGVLRAQIEALAPKVIITCGPEAARSLLEIGILVDPWEVITKRFNSGAYCTVTGAGGRPGVHVYCTYHTASRTVNGTLAGSYSDLTEAQIERKRSLLPDTAAVDAYLRQYPNTGAEGKGMRVLLLHWLDIGQGIRRAHGLDA